MASSIRLRMTSACGNGWPSAPEVTSPNVSRPSSRGCVMHMSVQAGYGRGRLCRDEPGGTHPHQLRRRTRAFKEARHACRFRASGSGCAAGSAYAADTPSSAFTLHRRTRMLAFGDTAPPVRLRDTIDDDRPDRPKGLIMTLLSRLALILGLALAATPALAQKAYIRNDLQAD